MGSVWVTGKKSDHILSWLNLYLVTVIWIYNLDTFYDIRKLFPLIFDVNFITDL